MFKNVGSTWLLVLLQIVVLMALWPFVLGRLGEEQNGVWVTIVAFTDVWKLLILGVPMATVRYVAAEAARGDLEAENRAISTCLGICLALGAAALAVAAASYLAFDAGWLRGELGSRLSPAQADGARIAFALVALQVAFGFAMRLPYAIFDAHGDFVVRNLIMAGELALRFGLTVALLSWRAELPVLAGVLAACMAAEFAAALLVIRRRHPGVRFALGGFDRRMMRGIFGFSLFAMLLNVGALLAFRMDALVIGAFLPAAEATYFDNGNKFFDPLMQLLIAVGAVVMPMATRLSTTGDVRELERVFLKWSKICLSVTLMVGLYLLVLGPRFLESWIPEAYVARTGHVLQVLMVSFFLYLPVRGVALPLLMGLGSPKLPAFAQVAMGALNLVLSLALVAELGILGVALGTAIPNVLFACIVAVAACRRLGVRVRDFLTYVAGRPLVGALAPLALLLWARYGLDVRGKTELAASGVAMVAVFAVVWVLWVYRDDPHVDLRGALLRVAPRRNSP